MYECIICEDLKEVGLEILELELIGISSNGYKIQYFKCEFYSVHLRGEIYFLEKICFFCSILIP